MVCYSKGMSEIKCTMCGGGNSTEFVLCSDCAEEARGEYYDSLDEDLAFERELRDSHYERPDYWRNNAGEYRCG